MMKLFYAPGTCSVGMHVLLEEIGAPYESVKVDFSKKEQFSDAFRAVNPKGKVPALVRGDGSVLTEFQTVAFWLARSHPEAKLLAEDLEGQTRTMEVMDFLVGSVHMRGFTFILVPMKFSPSEAAQSNVIVGKKAAQQDLVAHGREIVAGGFAKLDAMLEGRDWLMGDYSIADATLFYLTNWAQARGVDMPGRVAAFHQRMLERPAVQRALKQNV